MDHHAPHMRAIRRLAPASILVRLLVVVLGATAAIGVSAGVHRFLRADDILGGILPFDTRLTDLNDAILGAIAFVALGVGLVRRKRLARILAVALLASSAVIQAAALHHPVGAITAAVSVALLLAADEWFDVRTGGGTRVALALAVLAVAVVGMVVSAAAAAGGRSPAAALRTAAELAGSASFTDVRPLAALDARPGMLNLPVVAIRLAVAALALLILVPAPLAETGRGARARFLGVAKRYGSGALLPHQLTDDKDVFATDALDGAVVHGLAGRYAVVLGDPIGPIDAAWQVFDRFLAACHASGLIPAVYQASAASRGHLHAVGLRSVLVGREAVLELSGFSLDGSRRANLRHTVTRARRGGIQIEAHLDGLDIDARERLLPALRAIDAAWTARVGPQLGFTIGRFDPEALARTAIVVACEADGQPSAFATFLPTGVDGGYALDLMRRRPGGTPGAFEACVAEAAFALQARGATRLSLGLAPLSGLSAASDVPEERMLARMADLARRWYNVDGLAFFKQKFDPVWEPRYVAARSRLELMGLAMALVRLHVGGFRHAAVTLVASALRSKVRMASSTVATGRASHRRDAVRPGTGRDHGSSGDAA